MLVLWNLRFWYPINKGENAEGVVSEWNISRKINATKYPKIFKLFSPKKAGCTKISSLLKQKKSQTNGNVANYCYLGILSKTRHFWFCS